MTPTITWADIVRASLSSLDARLADLTDTMGHTPAPHAPIPLRVFASLATTTGADLACIVWRAQPTTAANRVSAEISMACALHVLPHVSADERRYAERLLDAARAHVDNPTEATRFNTERHLRDLRSRAGVAVLCAAWDALNVGIHPRDLDMSIYCRARDTLTAAVSAVAHHPGDPARAIWATAKEAALRALTTIEPAP